MNIRVTQSSIRVKPNGEVVIAEKDMTTGKVIEIPLVVKDGKVYAGENKDDG